MSYPTITNFMLVYAALTRNWVALFSFLRHMALPALAIGLTSAGLVARMARSSMLEVRGSDYLRTARAKGLLERRVPMTHALRNAVLPVLTLQGFQLGTLLGDAIVTELAFARPGMGRMLLVVAEAASA